MRRLLISQIAAPALALPLYAMVLLVLAANATAKTDPDLKLIWDGGRLLIQGTSPGPQLDAITHLINEQQFNQALAEISKLEAPDRIRGQLALAIAGHLELENPGPALEQAQRYLSTATADGNDTQARSLLHQLQLFEQIPSQGWHTEPRLLPARDLIRDGHVEQGLNKAINPTFEGRTRPIGWLPMWALAGFFEGEAIFDQILDEVLQRIPAEPENKRKKLLELAEQARGHEWATLVLQSDSLLYPRAMLKPMRSYYWWWQEMGVRYRPMSKQGFEELIKQIQPRFPRHKLVRLYSGEKIPWGQEFIVTSPGAPKWAVKQKELRNRVDHIVAWWFTNRQKPNGELGGGWEDDCETLRSWAIPAIVWGNKQIEEGIVRLVDGIWDSGKLVNGYDHAFKDVEHSSEMTADTSVILAINYGDPLYFERYLETTKTTADLHTAVNEHGHRHYKAMKMSATQVSTNPVHGVDALYCGRAMRPAAMIAWYAQLPRAVQLVHDWALAWSEDTERAGTTKPPGIMPMVVQFADDNIDGSDQWWEPGLGDLYGWNDVEQKILLYLRQRMVVGKMLGAWMWTNDQRVLDGLKSQLNTIREQIANPSLNPEAGTGPWAAQQLSGLAPQLAEWYRVVTADNQFDDLVESSSSTDIQAGDAPYGRYLISGDISFVEKAHELNLANLRLNLPMLTSEVQATDRVYMWPWSLLGPLTGSPVLITEPPTYAVTWRHVDHDFTALVRSFDSSSLSAWTYSFSHNTTEPNIRFWRLDPGLYELCVSIDNNGDGESDSSNIQTIPFKHQQRMTSVPFELPSQQLCLLEVTQIQRFPDLPEHLPDLAVMPRDLLVPDQMVAGHRVPCSLIVHNIGSADAENVEILVRATRKDQDATPFEIANLHLGTLPFPEDLVAKRAEARFEWIPEAAGDYTLEAKVQHGYGDAEIYTGNNITTIDVVVDSDS